MNWKNIPGFEGLYQASDCGQIKSIERYVTHPKGGLKLLKEKILKPGSTKDGYEYVVLYKEGVSKTYYVHRLVMFAHSHVDKELTINHIDENKRNNHISNLEYCSRGENIRKYNKNNPEKMSERGKIRGEVNKERCGHKIHDTYTGITYASMKEVGVMMHETGEAKSKWTWFHILQKGLPQDRFIRIEN